MPTHTPRCGLRTHENKVAILTRTDGNGTASCSATVELNRHTARQLTRDPVRGRFEGLANQSLRRMSSLTRGDHNSRSSINGVSEAGVPNAVASKLKGQSQKVVNANSAIEAQEAAAKPGYAPSNRVVPVVSSDEVTALEDNGAKALHALHAED